MTVIRTDKITKDQKWILTELLLLIVVLLCWDIWADLGSGVSTFHMWIEGFAGVLSLAVIVGIWWNQILPVHRALASTEQDRSTLEAELRRWRSSIEPYARSIQKEVDRQFEAWGLTPAEKETAFLLLKGLSLKEIAEVRAVSEKTVKQHNQAIYQKSRLKGRAELSAFFLEDLLTVPASHPEV